MNVLLALHLECYDGFQGAGVGKSSGSRARARVQSISMISDLADAGFFFLRGLKKSFIFCTNVGRAQTEPQMEFESSGLLRPSARLFLTQPCGAVCLELKRSAVATDNCCKRPRSAKNQNASRLLVSYSASSALNEACHRCTAMALMCVAVRLEKTEKLLYTLLHPNNLRERRHASVYLRQTGKLLGVAARRSAV